MVQRVVTLPIAARQTRDSAQFVPVGGYVAGPENALLAAVMSQLVADDDPDRSAVVPSPLVLIGPSGSGKSHLACGLYNRFVAQFGPDHVEQLTASDFRRQQQDAIRDETIGAWQQRMRVLDALVLEDIDHLSTRVALQQELVATLDWLDVRGSRIVVTSSRPPAHLDGWLPELTSRLHGGLTIEIAPLCPAARRALVEQLLERQSWNPTSLLVDAVVQHCPPEPPLVTRRIAELNQRFPGGAGATPADASRFLSEQVAASAPSLPDILRVVARYYNVPQRQIVSGSRQQQVVQARAMVTTLARRLTSLSYEQIGMKLGGRDHTTIMHHHRKIESRQTSDAALASALADIQQLLQTR